MKLRKLLYGVLGIASFVLSIVCYAMDTGSWESSHTYGGDAYTGIQNASAQAANNIQDLAAIVKFGFGSVLLIIGLLLIFYAVTCKETDYSSKFDMLACRIDEITPIVNKIKENTTEKEPEAPETDAVQK